MNIKDLKSGDMIKLHKGTLDRHYLFSSHVGFVEGKVKGGKTVIWFFTGGKSKIRRKKIGNNAAAGTLLKDSTASFHKRMMIKVFFENGLYNEARDNKISFGG
jgi:hypothetical protein